MSRGLVIDGSRRHGTSAPRESARPKRRDGTARPGQWAGDAGESPHHGLRGGHAAPRWSQRSQKRQPCPVHRRLRCALTPRNNLRHACERRPGAVVVGGARCAVSGPRPIRITGSRRDAPVDLRRIPDWGWTAAMAVATMLTLGLMFVLGPSGPFGTFQFPGTMIAIGLVAGLLARRTADLLGIVAGTVVFFEVLGVREIAQRGASFSILTYMFGTALVPGGFAAIIGLIVLGVRRGLRRVNVRSALLQMAGVAVVIGGLASLYVLGASRPSHAGVYRVTDERNIVITVTGGIASWCRVTSVKETTAEITVGAACVSLILGPTLAVGIFMDLPIHFERPLADRIVRNEDGSVVRRHPPPVHAIDPDRAMNIARGVLAADHPGIATGDTKVMDLSLEKDPTGRAAWKVNIIVVDGPFASSPPSTIWLWVDAESGAVTLISREWHGEAGGRQHHPLDERSWAGGARVVAHHGPAMTPQSSGAPQRSRLARRAARFATPSHGVKTSLLPNGGHHEGW